MPNRSRIYYLGAGHISIPVLEGLMRSDSIELCGIGTQQKNPRERGGAKRSAVSPLAKYAREKGMAIEMHLTVNTPEFRQMLHDRGVEILVVVSYGQLLKPELLAATPFGCLNVHASLLPKYRGASPIVAALLAGDPQAGVAFMKMEEGLDTGPIYQQYVLDVDAKDTAWTLEERLGILAGEHLADCIQKVTREGLKPVPQSAEEASSYARKMTKRDGQVNWNESAELLERKVRAWQPWPSLRAMVPARGGIAKMVKITEALVVPGRPEGSLPGDILAHGKDGILVACGEGALRIKRLVPEGKKEMNAADFLLGSPIPPDQNRMREFPEILSETDHH